jgi:hypothetical protein
MDEYGDDPFQVPSIKTDMKISNYSGALVVRFDWQPLHILRLRRSYPVRMELEGLASETPRSYTTLTDHRRDVVSRPGCSLLIMVVITTLHY